MARNIEIKARIDCVDALMPLAAAVSDEGPIEIEQDDTFFDCAAGRLKLRVFPAGDGELIFYRRENRHGPKESFYLRSPTATPDSLRATLSAACGYVGRVRKKRTLFLIGRTRIHLDRVEGLGHFLELEVVLDDGEPAETGAEEAHRLMQQLQIRADDLIADAYVDLLPRTGATATSVK